MLGKMASEAATKLFAGSSSHAALYALYRPTYPTDLYARVAAVLNGSGPALDRRALTALDLACGSGQVTVELAKDGPFGGFGKIFGVDVSADQIQQAEQHPNIQYSIGSASDTGVKEDHSVDVVTIGQACHWFSSRNDPARIPFGQEMDRIVTRAPHGLIAMFGYSLGMITDPRMAAANAEIIRVYSEVLGDKYWNPLRKIIDDGLREIISPTEYGFPHEERFSLKMTKEHNADSLIGYLHSWSGYQAWEKEHRGSGEEDAFAPLQRILANPEFPTTFTVEWPLYVIIGRRAAP
eukprot:gnl/Hemi2/27644_TR9133_c0_g1_i1.p1 gnl/Hemi2/27644_TR9133_c0_g1~~gnl/Hemi2/27644_TR9133_c0_g1_i1.p1  ORF type:complete len:294 (-),score=51.49 gnl/Hemi2/27644_TR9133_c0_g1_i1:199-1080(-)